MLQRSGLSTIGDILRHRRLSLFGHVARLDPGVPAHDALHLMVDNYEGRKPIASWRRPPGRPRDLWLDKVQVQQDANALPLSTLWPPSLAFSLYIGGFPCAQLPGPVHSSYSPVGPSVRASEG